MPADDHDSQQTLAAAVTEVSERASLLVREEIELAKVEVTEKVTKLAKGAAVGAAAGVFAVIGVLFLLHGIAWVFYDFVFSHISYGYFIVAIILFALGGLAGFLAAKALRSGAPPKPTMAIDEARKIRATVTPPSPGSDS